MKLNESHWQIINNYPNSIAKNNKNSSLSFIKDTKSRDRFIKKMKLKRIKTEGSTSNSDEEDIIELLPKFIIKHIDQSKFDQIMDIFKSNESDDQKKESITNVLEGRK